MTQLLLAAAAAGVIIASYRLSGWIVPWRLARSVLTGLATACITTIWVGTVRHAALLHSAAQPAAGGQKLSPGTILILGFAGVLVLVTAAVFAVTTAAAAVHGRGDGQGRRSGQRPARHDSGRRARPAGRGWGKA